MMHLRKKLLILTSFLLLMFGSVAAEYSGPESVNQALERVKKLLPDSLETASELAKEIHEYCLLLDNDSLMAKSFYTLGLVEYFRSAYEFSAQYYLHALQSDYASVSYPFSSSCWNNLGINYEISGKYEQAIAAYLKSIGASEFLADSTGVYQSYINLGYLYSRVKDFGQSEYYLTRALRYFKGQHDLYNQALCYQNLGIRANDLQLPEQAIDYYSRAQQLYATLNNPGGELECIINMVDTQLESDNTAGVDSLLMEATRKQDQLHDDFLLALVKNLYAKYYLALHQYRNAEVNLLEALSLFERTGAHSKIRYVYYLLVRLYTQTGNEPMASRYLDLYDEATFTLFNEEKAAAMAEFKTIYEDEKKVAMIRALDNEVQMKNRYITLWVLVSLVFLISSVIIYLLLLKNKKKQRALYDRNIELLAMKETEVNYTLGADEKPTPESEDRFFMLFQDLKKRMIKDQLYLDSNLKVADLAALLFTNEKYVSNVISKFSGLNFNGFVNSYRVNEARKLLSSSRYQQLTYEQLARRAGFSNEYTFQKKFKEMTGMTPKSFRRQVRASGLNAQEMNTAEPMDSGLS